MKNLLRAGAMALALTTSLTACNLFNGKSTPTAVATQATTDVGKVATDVQNACTQVTATATAIQASPLDAIPQVASTLPYVTASCGTAAAVAAMVTKAVADPSTVAWITGLNTDLVAIETKVKGL